MNSVQRTESEKFLGDLLLLQDSEVCIRWTLYSDILYATSFLSRN